MVERTDVFFKLITGHVPHTHRLYIILTNFDGIVAPLLFVKVNLIFFK